MSRFFPYFHLEEIFLHKDKIFPYNSLMTNLVGLQKCQDYDFEKVYQAIKKLFELVPPPDVKDKVVLLKPNILYPKKPELAVCTHPVLVGASVKAFVELGAKKVYAGESPAIAGSTSAAKFTGIYDQVVNNGGEWIDFKDAEIIECPQGKTVKQLNFTRAFRQADVVVSLSKLKSHQLMAYTGAMKNLFGLVIGLEKSQAHYRFPNKSDFASYITDLNIAANPQYAIMDAIVGMEGPGGPGGGDPIHLGFIAASDNILALDWKCSSLVGYNPHEITNLEDALKRGIWLKSEKDIQVVGEKEEDCRSRTFKIVKDTAPTLQKMMPAVVNVLATYFFVKTPHFNSKKCVKCGKCMQICPPKVIQMKGKNGTATLTDKKKCQHCFCCHEICPNNAIKLKRF